MSDDSQPAEHDRGNRADRVSFVVYGTIAVLAATGGLALESQALHPLETAAVLMVVAVAAWMAHSMWRVVRARALRDAPAQHSHEHHELLTSWPIVASGLPGALVMVLTTTNVWSVAHGLAIAQGVGVAVLAGAGLVTARLAGATGFGQLVYVVTLPCVGLVIVALEVAAHHV